MIDATALPILIKAVDFLFDECGKILEERRNRRQAVYHNEKIDDKLEINKESMVDKKAVSRKEDILKIQVMEQEWKETEKEIAHLMKILETHKKNYRLHKEQYEIHGEAFVPQLIARSLENDENGIIKVGKELQIALSRLYKTNIIALEEDG